MRIYLAGAWSRREELLQVANNLESMGHVITSRWLTQETAEADQDREDFLARHADMDMRDVITADAIIRFSDAEEMGFPLAASKLVSGARHFEFGGMWMLNKVSEYLREIGYTTAEPKLMFVVGGKQNIFDRLPEVMHIEGIFQMYGIFWRAAELQGLLPMVGKDYTYEIEYVWEA